MLFPYGYQKIAQNDFPITLLKHKKNVNLPEAVTQWNIGEILKVNKRVQYIPPRQWRLIILTLKDEVILIREHPIFCFALKR